MTIEYGRLKFTSNVRLPGTSNLIIENTDRDEDHWVSLSSWYGGDRSEFPIGWLFFKRIAPHTFELTEVRQGGAPLPCQPDPASVSGAHPLEASE